MPRGEGSLATYYLRPPLTTYYLLLPTAYRILITTYYFLLFAATYGQNEQELCTSEHMLFDALALTRVKDLGFDASIAVEAECHARKVPPHLLLTTPTYHFPLTTSHLLLPTADRILITTYCFLLLGQIEEELCTLEHMLFDARELAAVVNLNNKYMVCGPHFDGHVFATRDIDTFTLTVYRNAPYKMASC